MKYLKRFNNEQEYEEYFNSSGYITPNISYCNSEQSVHYSAIDGEIEPEPEPSINVVDLGLPSGTLWATENLKDANGNELYFAWGEISGYTAAQVGVDKSFNVDWSDYQFGNPPSKYNETDGKSTLEDVDNPAKVHFGNGYTMPTKDQFDELYANTTSAFTQFNGVNGLLLTSTANTNTIFFPAAGYGNNGHVNNVGSEGYYWSSSLNAGNVLSAWALGFDSSGSYDIGSNSRFYGFSVRPVVVQNQ